MNWTRSFRAMPFVGIGIAAAITYAITAFFVPRSAGTGILIAFLFWSGISIGSLTALMIHRLTGGEWGYANARAFQLAAGALPFVAVMAVIVFALLPVLYPWARGTPAAAADVTRWYLNSPLFILRTCVAFGGWFAIFFLLRLPGRAGILAAGIGLAFHGLIIGVVGLDWIQSVEPPFFSSSFGASFAFTQLLAGFAAAAIVAPPENVGRATFDLSGLMLATILGLTYIDFMAVLIIWYGNLPQKVEWFVQRAAFPWPTIAIVTFVLVVVVPFFLLLLMRLRSNREYLRVVAGVVLVGIALYYAWLVGPASGPASIPMALFAIAASGLLLIGLVSAASSVLWHRLGVTNVD